MEHKVLEVMLLKASRDGNFQYPFLKSVIDADKFNAVTGSSIHVDKRCYIRLNQSGVDSDHDENKLDTMDINLISGEISGNFKFQESVNGINFNRLELFSMDNIILMNSEDYNGFKSKVGDSELEKVHLINFKNWKNSRSTVRKLNDGLKAWNKTTPESSFIKEYGGGIIKSLIKNRKLSKPKAGDFAAAFYMQFTGVVLLYSLHNNALLQIIF